VKLIIFVYILFFSNIYAAKIIEYESQPNILKENKYIKKQLSLYESKTQFNIAVLYLEQEKYLKAISIFKKTANKLKVESFLNIGIAYYKLKSQNNSYLYLKKLYDLKNLNKQNIYAYVSTCYYLYLITKNRKYLSDILGVLKDKSIRKQDENTRLLLVNTYIILKQYKKAIRVLRTLNEYNYLKLALLYIKAKDYDNSEVYLQKALNQTKDEKSTNDIIWFTIYNDLKTNSISKLKDHIDLVDDRLDEFRQYPRMDLRIYFNKDKYSSKDYFNMVNNFSKQRKIDMLFYFTPFIFADNKELKQDSIYAFILKDINSIEALNDMIEYNKNFTNIVKKDPIIRANELQKQIDKKDKIKSYEYYNLALSYAQIFDYKNAYKNFYKAYLLKKSNKLYSSLVLVSALRANIKLNKKEKAQIKDNLVNFKGQYVYFGHYIYKIFFSKNYKIEDEKISLKYKNSVFYRALHFIDNKNEKDSTLQEPLLLNDGKDPLVFLFRTIVKKENESDYTYVARLQDYLPKHYNDYFLKGPLIITEYYIDILKAVGIFNKVNFNIPNDNTPTYLRTKALINLYDGYPIQSIKILEDIKNKYNLNDKYTYNLLVASYLSAGDYVNASATLTMMEFELKDDNARFLNGIQLLQDLKLNSAKSSFRKPYTGRLIDFELKGFDKYLEDL
jgi:hypothetical protein